MDLYGNYIPGLCAGLAISLKDLAAPLSAEHYPVLTTLFFKGIRGLFALAEQTFDYTPKRNAYLNKCDLCREIRKFFVRRGFGGARELAPIEFYDLKPADPKSEFQNRIA
jgi:hypothetical protein